MSAAVELGQRAIDAPRTHHTAHRSVGPDRSTSITYLKPPAQRRYRQEVCSSSVRHGQASLHESHEHGIMLQLVNVFCQGRVLALAGALAACRLAVSIARSLWGRDASQKAGEQSQVGIVWLWDDVRLEDHEPLLAAHQQCQHVVPVYVLDVHNHQKAAGCSQQGSTQLAFLLDRLNDLRTRLTSLGSELLLRSGRPEHVLPQLVRAIQRATQSKVTVFFHQQLAPMQQQVQDTVAALLTSMGATVQMFWSGSTLHHVEDLPCRTDSLPRNYERFRDAVANVPVRPPQPAPSMLKGWPNNLSLHAGRIPTCEQLELTCSEAGRGKSLAVPNAIQQLFCKTSQLSSEFETDVRSTVQLQQHLSLCLSTGSMSARQIYHMMQASQEDLSPQCLGVQQKAEQPVQDVFAWVKLELLWRDFFSLSYT